MIGWLTNIANGIKNIGWMLVPGLAVLVFLEWLIREWIPARASEVLDSIKEKIGESVSIDFASVAIDWSRINQWVPVTEIVQYGIRFLAVAAVLVVIRTVRRLVPFGA